MSAPHEPVGSFEELGTGRWRPSWSDGWVRQLAGTLTGITTAVRNHPPQLTDHDGEPIAENVVTWVVANSVEAVLTATRAAELDEDDLSGLAAAALNLSVIAAALDHDLGSTSDRPSGDNAAVAWSDTMRKLALAVRGALETTVDRLPDGSFRFGWRKSDVAWLDLVSERLDAALDSHDDSIERLFPPAYGDDHERNAGYDALMRSELIATRRASLEVLLGTVGQPELDEDGLDSAMRAVNDLRIYLGTVLGISEDQPPANTAEPTLVIAYERLSILLVRILEARDD
jgi:hypothetical protein